MNDSNPQPGDSLATMDPSDANDAPVRDTPGRLPGPLDGAVPPLATVEPDSSLIDALEDSNSADSTVSSLSGMSSLSGKDWKPHAGPMSWIHRQMLAGADPRHILAQLIPMHGEGIPTNIDDISLWKLIVDILTEPPRRRRLRHVNTLEDVRRLVRCSRKIVIVTGAGVSVSCGIPDFRSRNGLYARLAVDFPTLPDPQAMFDISYFEKDPRPFFKFAREIYPGQFQPSPAHRFIKLIEKHGKLLRNYSQNIDTLENVAGIANAIHCHGSFGTATCMRCGLQVDSEAIREDIFNQKIPVCVTCCPSGDLQVDFDARSRAESVETGEQPFPILKPDIVFFGEGLPEKFHTSMAADKDECDLLIVIGSSLKVRPVALIPSSVPHHVPLILINREPLNHVNFDVQLLGDCDVICNELCRQLGESWTAPGLDKPALKEISSLPSKIEPLKCEIDLEPTSEHDLEALRLCWQPKVKQSVAERLPEGTFLHLQPNRYIFPGAEVFVDADDEDEDNSSSTSSVSSGNSTPGLINPESDEIVPASNEEAVSSPKIPRLE